MTSTKFTSQPLFTRRQLTALLLPLIAEQALSVTIGLADTLMVSSVGEAAVSGVSLVDTFNTLMIQIMSALATGGAVVASQYIGHREEKNARASAAQILFILSVFSLAVAAVVVVGRHAILRGIFGSIDADVMRYAETYFLLSALSYPFIGLYNAGAALFRAQGNSKVSMMFQIGKLSVASLTSTLGTAAIAANAVANTTSTFLNIPASAVGLAVLTVVGQCLGAGEKEQAVWYARRLLLLAYAGAWIMNLSAFFFADKLALTLFHLSPEAQAMALQVMQWFNIFSIFFWPSSFTLPNILRAAGDASFTMSVSIVSMWVFRVGFCYLMVLCFHGQLLSIWMGMFLDWVFRSVCFMVRFVRGKWLEQHVI